MKVKFWCCRAFPDNPGPQKSFLPCDYLNASNYLLLGFSVSSCLIQPVFCSFFTQIISQPKEPLSSFFTELEVFPKSRVNCPFSGTLANVKIKKKTTLLDPLVLLSCC